MRLRRAVRALVLDPDDRVLLVRFEFPDGTVWAAPGGGVEAAEDELDALRRELVEEVGLDAVEIGPPVWTRTHVIPMHTGHDGQTERFFLVRTTAFEPAPGLDAELLLAEGVHELRWWTAAEIAAASTQERTWFAPSRLGALLSALLADGVPPTPTDVGI